MNSEREFKFAILDLLLKNGRKYKWNVLRPGSLGGDLELHLGIELDDMARARARRAWDSLQNADLIVSDGRNISDPENWLHITEKGKSALERHALDDLDEALSAIDQRLVEQRDEAWATLERGGDEAFAQAASTMCEVVDRTLRALAPAKEVRGQAWFERADQPTPAATRAERARLIMERRHGRHSEDICRSLVAAHEVLTGLKHASRTYPKDESLRALVRAEDTLRQVLFWPTKDEADQSESG